MAITITNLVEVSSTSWAATTSSGAYAAPANALLLCFVAMDRMSGDATITWGVNWNKYGTWTKVAETTGPDAKSMVLYSRTTTSAVSDDQVQITGTASGPRAMSVISIEGLDTNTILKYGVAGPTGDSGDSVSLEVDLSGAPSSGNPVLAAFGASVGTTSTATTPSGFSDVLNTSGTGRRIRVFKSTSTSSAATTCTDLGTGISGPRGITVELDGGFSSSPGTITTTEGSATAAGGAGDMAGGGPDPVAHWKASDLSLSDGAAVSSWVDSVGSVTLAPTAGLNPTYDVDGIGGQPAVTLSRADTGALYTATAQSLPRSPISVTAVLQTDGGPSGGAYWGNFFCLIATGNNHADLSLAMDGSGRWEAYTSLNDGYSVPSSPTVSANTTYIVTHSFDPVSGAFAWYVNGTQIASGTNTSSTETGTNRLYVGAWFTASDYFGGKLAELKVYDAALTSTQAGGEFDTLAAIYLPPDGTMSTGAGTAAAAGGTTTFSGGGSSGTFSTSIAAAVAAGGTSTFGISAVFGGGGTATRYLGTNDNPVWNTSSQHTTAVGYLSDANCPVVRIACYWSLIEGTQGTKSGTYLDRMDDYISKCYAAGVKVLLVFQGAPSWASLDGTSNVFNGVADAHFDDFADFVAWCVDRWYGAGVDAVEVWNEPNLGQFWAGASYNGGILGNYPGTQTAKYSDLIKAVYPAVKAVAPDCPVVGGCTFTAQYNYQAGSTHDWRCDAFMDALTTNDAWSYMDVFSFHNYPMHVTSAYPSITAGNQPWYDADTPDASIIGMGLNRLLPLMQAAGVGDMPIWYTEGGFESSGTGDNAVTEAVQADKIAELGTMFAAQEYDTNLVRIYQFSQYDNGDGDWGLIGSTPKDSWTEFVNATKTITSGTAGAMASGGSSTFTVTATLTTLVGSAAAAGGVPTWTGDATFTTLTGAAMAGGGDGTLTGGATLTAVAGSASAAGGSSSWHGDATLTSSTGDATAAGGAGTFTGSGSATLATSTGVAVAAGGDATFTGTAPDATFITTAGAATATGGAGSMSGTATFTTTVGLAAAAGRSGALTGAATFTTSPGAAAAAGSDGASIGDAAWVILAADATAAGGLGSLLALAPYPVVTAPRLAVTTATTGLGLDTATTGLGLDASHAALEVTT